MKKALLPLLLVAFAYTKGNAQSAEEFYTTAMQYKSKENLTEAHKQMQKALQLTPESEKFKAAMAEIQYHRRVFFEAIPLYEEMLRKDEKNVVLLARLAEMYSMSPQKMKGVEYAERAGKLKPTDGEINKLLARTFLEVKHYPKAIRYYLEAEKMLPNDKDIPFKLGAAYAAISQFGDAMHYYEKAMNLDPNNPTKIYEAANSCYDANNYKRALELYQLAEDKGAFKTKALYENWAMTYAELKQFDYALFYYTKAKEFAPFDKDVNMSIAEIYMKKGDFERSRNVLNELLDMMPNDGELVYTMGMTYYKAGNTSKAESYFNRAFELDPSLKTLRYTKSNF